MLAYLIFRIVRAIFQWIPFRLLYVLADGAAFLLYYVIGYRKKVVQHNLQRVYPDKSKQEIDQITKAFYQHLADITVESIKGFKNKEEARERMFGRNPEVLDHYISQGRSAMAIAGHYGNWEWGGIGGCLYVNSTVLAIYKPLSNKRINQFLANERSKWGMLMMPMAETTQTFDEYAAGGNLFVMVGDQSPSKVEKAIWIDFLGQETACLHGIEKHARKHNLPLIFIDIVRVKRGKYEMTMRLVTDEPTALAPGEITKKYMRFLERQIYQSPSAWLWSHKRWKHNKDGSKVKKYGNLSSKTS